MSGELKMLNFIWCIMLLLSFVSVLLNGSSSEAVKALYSAIESAVKLSVTLLGVMAFWSGISRICEKNGITAFLSRLLHPILIKLFPKSSKDEEALRHITMNLISNLMGLGNAATPHGIKAVSRIQKKGEALNSETIMFIVINTCSLQLIPTNISALRINYNSKAPLSVLPHIWIVSACTLIFGIILCFILGKISERKYKNGKFR